MTPQIIKFVLGIDISKDSIEVCFGSIDVFQQTVFGKSTSFANNALQFNKLLRWVDGQRKGNPDVPLLFVMEATGVYYETLAHFLVEKGHQVVVELPNRICHYAKTFAIKSKTDKIDSRLIAQYGLERSLPLWNPPTEQLRAIRTLTREYQNLKDLETQVKNQLHAKEHTHKTLPSTVKRLHAQLKLYEKQVSLIEKELRKLIDQDPDLKAKVDRIDSIDGVGWLTAICVIAETNNFALIHSAKQLASYAGLDIQLKQSGKRQGQSSISKKGNSMIRKVLFMPTLAAIRSNENLKLFYQRLVIRKNSKKIAVIAVLRKLLCLIYTIWKKNEFYDAQYNLKRTNLVS